jgi:hypothetical protein
MDQKRAAIPLCDGRIKEIAATVVADSDERSRRSGVFSGLRKGGERGRRGRALYRRGVATKWASIQGH